MTDSLRDILQRALGEGYRVERELGGGGMSRVFVARDLALDRDVVVKVLSRDATAGVSGDRFRREIQVIARLQHPHIVSILSAGTADGALYYVMPFIGGESLRARLSREGPLAVADAVRILREVLDALAFAHKHGVIHRDIKPENVLVEAGHCVVADFGIAKALRESGTMTSAGVALGTPAYMSPEQATADPTADHRADLYAVGVLAYELLAGVPPFSGTAQQVITAHITTAAPALRDRRSDVPEGLSELVARALEKEPGERPQSASEMLATLEALVTPSATTARSGILPASVAAAPPARRRVPPVAIAAALVLAVGLFFQLRRDQAPAPLVAAGADAIAVMPLGAVSDTSLTRLGQDLVVTLSTNLDGVGSLRTIDAITLLMRTRRHPSPIPLQDARRLAQELGARSVITGTLITEGNRVRASITLHAVESDSLLARATALAAPDGIAALTDSLTWGILQQVWRRGSAPSPVLTGLTTKSFDALRAFLDGERHFQRLDNTPALAAYRRAFDLDSNFAQAFLRYDFVNAWNLQPRDSFVHSRLLALSDRLPERERLWLQTSDAAEPLPRSIERWQELVRRYPDYPPVLMSAADAIIHEGPLYGISLADAQPLLDRLSVLVPDHADTKFHQAAVDMRTANDSAYIASAEAAGRASAPPTGVMMQWMSEVRRARAAGQPLPPAERAFELARSLANQIVEVPAFAFAAGIMGFDYGDSRYRLEVLDRIRQAGIYSPALVDASAYGEGLLRISRGNWTGGIAALRRSERAMGGPSLTLTGARLAAIGAWLDAVSARTADSIVARARGLVADGASRESIAEWEWSNGLVGVALGDEPRVRSSVRELSSLDAGVARHAARSLNGLWLARTNAEAGADSVKAATDEAMQRGGFLLAAEAVNRFVVARALRRRGAPAEVARYLMYVDAGVNSARNFSVNLALSTLVAYERGLALDEAGDREGAVRQLRAFVSDYDQPAPAFAPLVEDARQRLARLEPGDVSAQPRSVPPRE